MFHLIGKLRLKELIAAGEANPNDASKDFIKITTCSGATPFSEDQIGNDSIDLRTGNEGYRMKRNYEFISTLDENIDECFERFTLSTEEGLIIDPGETVVVSSAERIQLSGPYFGEIMGRTRFARMGLSVHCSSPKFQGNSDAIVAFQITNHNLVPIKVFPYQPIAQMVIQKVEFYPPEAQGDYKSEQELLYPIVNADILSSYNKEDQGRIRKNKSKLSKRKNKNGEINQIFGIQRSLVFLIVALDISILILAVSGILMSEEVFHHSLWFAVITAILTSISGVLSIISKGSD